MATLCPRLLPPIGVNIREQFERNLRQFLEENADDSELNVLYNEDIILNALANLRKAD